MKEKLMYGICGAIILWLIVSTVEVWVHNATETEITYSKANVWVQVSSHTTDMKVVDCQGYFTDDYKVTVEDINGNQWAYIDTEPKELGTVLSITMSGDEIIDAR